MGAQLARKLAGAAARRGALQQERQAGDVAHCSGDMGKKIVTIDVAAHYHVDVVTTLHPITSTYSVVQGGFSAGSTLALAAHPEHEFKKLIHTTSRCVLGFLFMPYFWVV